MKTNDEKLIEVAGIDYQGFHKPVSRDQASKLMEWAMLKGFWQGAIGGAGLIGLIWIMTN